MVQINAKIPKELKKMRFEVGLCTNNTLLTVQKL
jgi:hypothetical protein